MYSRSRDDGGVRRRLRHRCSLLTLTVITSAILLVQCRWVDPFAEYSGVDLIGDRGFSVDSFTHAYMDGTDPATSFEYVRVTPVTAAEYGATTGLPAEHHATIRRLEAVNLFPDGDFEASTAGLPPIHWTTSPFPNEPTDFTVDAGGVIQGNSVHFDVAGEAAAVVHLDTSALDGFVEPAVYFVSLQFVRSAPVMRMTFDYGDDATTSHLANRSWVIDVRTDTPLETLPTRGDPLLDKVTIFPASGTGVNYFYVGAPGGAAGQSGHLDNVRLGRLDSLPHVAIPIGLENADGELPLVPGTYRVTLFVKSEIADQVTPSANGRNRFRAGQIVLGLNGHFLPVSRSTGGWSTTEWKEVSASFQITAAELAHDPPLQVRLTVIDPENPVVGSLLIAAPTVELVSNNPRN